MLLRKRILLVACAAALGSFSAHAQLNRSNWLAGGTLGFSQQAQEQHRLGVNPVTTTFRVNPRVGYFITNNVAAGVRVGYGHTSEKTETKVSHVPNVGYTAAIINSDFTRKHNEYMAGLFVQRYWRLGDRLHLFIQGDGAYTKEITTTKSAVTAPQFPPIGPLLAERLRSDTVAYSPAQVITSPLHRYDADSSKVVTGRLAFSLSPGIVYLATRRLGLTLMMGEATLQFKSTSLFGPSRQGLKFDSYGLDLGVSTLQAGFQFHL